MKLVVYLLLLGLVCIATRAEEEAQEKKGEVHETKQKETEKESVQKELGVKTDGKQESSEKKGAQQKGAVVDEERKERVGENRELRGKKTAEDLPQVFEDPRLRMGTPFAHRMPLRGFRAQEHRDRVLRMLHRAASDRIGVSGRSGVPNRFFPEW